MLGLDLRIDPAEVENYENFVGEDYGIPSPEGNEAVRLFARHEGIILDSIYTGKCAAAMIAHIRAREFGRNDVVVFVHTGGMPAVFTWSDAWLPCA